MLIARGKRLANAAARAGLRAALDIGAQTAPDAAAQVTSRTFSIAELTTAIDRFDCALRLLVEATGARSGRLYLLEHGKLRLVAASGGDEPPEALASAA